MIIRYRKTRGFVFMVLAALFVMQSAFAMDQTAQDAILIFGHKNPDTDTVMSAIAAAQYLNHTGRSAAAAVQGEVNPETAHVLKTFGLALPETIAAVAGKQIGLVDFNEYPQGPEDMQKADLVFLVDHHRLGGMTSNAPMEAWLQPVGCTCTILFEMLAARGIEIPGSLAGGMLAAILSDTVTFRSATTTDRDRTAAGKLAAIAGIADMDAFGKELFAVKSDFRDASSRTLLLRDYKSYVMGGRKIGIGQIEALDIAELDNRRGEFIEEMAALKNESESFAIILMLTDISREGAEMLVLADDPDAIAGAFSATLENGSFWLEGVMSRKKQVVPPLERIFETTPIR